MIMMNSKREPSYPYLITLEMHLEEESTQD